MKTTFWTIRGNYYDLTDWYDSHPGGRHLLEITRGTDCTELFESYHAASLKEHYITSKLADYLVKDNRVWRGEKSPVYEDLKAVVRDYRREYGIKATDDWRMIAWYGIVCVVHVITWFSWFQGTASTIMLTLQIITQMQWCASITHDGCHYALTTSPWWNEWFATNATGPFFVLRSTWIRQHVIGHHVHTNVSKRDPDLYHHKPWWRTIGDQRWNKWYPNWWKWIMIIPSITFIGPFVFRLGLINNGRWPGTLQKTVWSKGEYWRASLQWGMVAVVHLLVAVRSGFFYALLPGLGGGVYYYAVSQISHINAQSFQNPSTKEWAVRQFNASQGDYSYQSSVWNKVSLGLNNQTLHHCFPTIHPCHFVKLSRRLKPVFERHGLHGSGWSQTYWDSLKKHLNHLSTLNTAECVGTKQHYIQ